jgi:hypothetical protein
MVMSNVYMTKITNKSHIDEDHFPCVNVTFLGMQFLLKINFSDFTYISSMKAIEVISLQEIQ